MKKKILILNVLLVVFLLHSGTELLAGDRAQSEVLRKVRSLDPSTHKSLLASMGTGAATGVVILDMFDGQGTVQNPRLSNCRKYIQKRKTQSVLTARFVPPTDGFVTAIYKVSGAESGQFKGKSHAVEGGGIYDLTGSSPVRNAKKGIYESSVTITFLPRKSIHSDAGSGPVAPTDMKHIDPLAGSTRKGTARYICY